MHNVEPILTRWRVSKQLGFCIQCGRPIHPLDLCAAVQTGHHCVLCRSGHEQPEPCPHWTLKEDQGQYRCVIDGSLVGASEATRTGILILSGGKRAMVPHPRGSEKPADPDVEPERFLIAMASTKTLPPRTRGMAIAHLDRIGTKSAQETVMRVLAEDAKAGEFVFSVFLATSHPWSDDLFDPSPDHESAVIRHLAQQSGT